MFLRFLFTIYSSFIECYFTAIVLLYADMPIIHCLLISEIYYCNFKLLMNEMNVKIITKLFGVSMDKCLAKTQAS